VSVIPLKSISLKPKNESLAFFKENIQQNYFMGKYPHTR
jgi:hypothetical protein